MVTLAPREEDSSLSSVPPELAAVAVLLDASGASVSSSVSSSSSLEELGVLLVPNSLEPESGAIVDAFDDADTDDNELETAEEELWSGLVVDLT